MAFREENLFEDETQHKYLLKDILKWYARSDHLEKLRC